MNEEEEQERKYLDFTEVYELMALFARLQSVEEKATLRGRIERLAALLKMMELLHYEFSDRQAMFNAIRDFPELEGLRR